MLKYRFISSPDEETIDLLRNRVRAPGKKKIEKKGFGALCLLQTNVASLFFYADIAVKAADVMVLDVIGNCPQSFTTIALLGTMESVKSALKAIIEEGED